MADTRAQTWSALLAGWTDFARSAAALPKSGDAGLLRRSVPAIIGLQALTHAMREIDTLPSAEYAPGVDRASIGVRTLVQELHAIWRGEPMPDALAEIIADARDHLDIASSSGVEFVPVDDPYQVPAIDPSLIERWIRDYTIDGELWLAPASLVLRASLPVCFLKEPSGRPPAAALLGAIADALPGCLWRRVPRMRQVYQTLDASGAVKSFVVKPMNELPVGRPLLRQVVARGSAIDAFGSPSVTVAPASQHAPD
ncbi:MAG: hypothetical protein ACK58T_32740 [Phycisphaerae bacterium]